MPKSRVSTTVDTELLARARAAHGGGTDASLLEAALLTLLAQHRTAEVDESYATAYARQPADAPDEWGDLGSWADAVRRERGTTRP